MLKWIVILSLVTMISVSTWTLPSSHSCGLLRYRAIVALGNTLDLTHVEGVKGFAYNSGHVTEELKWELLVVIIPNFGEWVEFYWRFVSDALFCIGGCRIDQLLHVIGSSR